jgi:hypothetical protein
LTAVFSLNHNKAYVKIIEGFEGKADLYAEMSKLASQ